MELETRATVQVTLGMKAEQVCLKRMDEIRRRLEPGDVALERLILGLQAELYAQLAKVACLGPADAVLPSEAQAEVLPEFPSVRERLGEAPLTRDSAMYYIETLKEEAYRFFKRMARAAEDENARSLFTRIALGELGAVARLREVVL